MPACLQRVCCERARAQQCHEGTREGYRICCLSIPPRACLLLYCSLKVRSSCCLGNRSPSFTLLLLACRVLPRTEGPVEQVGMDVSSSCVFPPPSSRVPLAPWHPALQGEAGRSRQRSEGEGQGEKQETGGLSHSQQTGTRLHPEVLAALGSVSGWG